ncbi:MAG: GNAT family N-acetyltransferase [Anaerolineales bacterium]|nr:GNAT family N-acetyltransferase [Anaerolineales bacterium]
MELLTARLRLREFVAEDWRAVLAYQQEPLYLRYYAWTERTPEAVQAFVGWFLAQQAATPRDKYQFAVTLKDTGELIGNCGVRRTAPGALEADLGYELAPAYWGKGYATEAARAVLAFGFAALGAHRLEAQCVADNIASARVLEKIGMRLEGRLRDKEYFKGCWWDRLIYAALAGEGEVGG